ncbi:hypothetical protein BVY04_01800 [bacterium M21]|nr:hypothetical protein BVY04_01800 [bacterium M21]
MNAAKAKKIETVLIQVDDGFLFERFAQDLLGIVVGAEFIGTGGQKDKGIDGLQYTYFASNKVKTIYQMSIEKDSRKKIEKSIQKLQDNAISFDRFFYVTNKRVKDQDALIEDMHAKYGAIVTIWDLTWLRSQVNYNNASIKLYYSFIEAHYHDYGDPGRSKIMIDFSGDPRVYVFLRQQVENKYRQGDLFDTVINSLIIYALEGTDPDKGILMSTEEIRDRISQIVSFDTSKIDFRKYLRSLSEKGLRKVRHHQKVDRFCLPYSTRKELQDMNFEDTRIYDGFIEAVSARIAAAKNGSNVETKLLVGVLLDTINRVFKQEGLEFSDFVLNDGKPSAVEHSVPDLVNEAVTNSGLPGGARSKARSTILSALRDTIYHGGEEEREYLRRLSSSYMTLFLLQCDPKVASYFETMASKLEVFVCTSILVPALSEYRLPEENRRHWNLLKCAHAAGVRLRVNGKIMGELAAHIRNSVGEYAREYAGQEHIFASREGLAYVDKIMIRSFFYHKIEHSDASYEDFLDAFVTAKATQEVIIQELLIYLADRFGIEYEEDGDLPKDVDQSTVDSLVARLSAFKASKTQAKNDVQTILSVYARREKNRELGKTSVFGYRTWWLSKDTTTFRAVSEELGARFGVSCYMRPDFLYNYISLGPKRSETGDVFDRFFPTMLGVSLSHHVPRGIAKQVRTSLKRHSELDPSRVKAKLANFVDELKSEAERLPESKMTHFLEDLVKS